MHISSIIDSYELIKEKFDQELLTIYFFICLVFPKQSRMLIQR